MRKIALVLVLMTFCLPAFTIETVPHGGSESLYYFHFVKTGENNLRFFFFFLSKIIPTAISSFSFPIVQTPTSEVSFEIGLYYEVYVPNYKLSAVFSSESFGVDGNGYMLTHVNSTNAVSHGLNYSVEVNEEKTQVDNLNADNIIFSAYAEDISNEIPLSSDIDGGIDRTLVLIDSENSVNQSSVGKIYLNLTMRPPTSDGYASGQYTGNIFLVLETYS